MPVPARHWLGVVLIMIQSIAVTSTKIEQHDYSENTLHILRGLMYGIDGTGGHGPTDIPALWQTG